MNHQNATILIADDDQTFRAVVERNLTRLGYQVREAGDGEAAMEQVDDSTAVVVLDLRMPKANGLEVFQHIKQSHPRTKVIILSGVASSEEVVKVMKLGAFYFLEKPFDRVQLTTLVEVAYELFQLEGSREVLEAVFSTSSSDLVVRSGSPIMMETVKQLQKVAPLDSTVLLTGESGVGKTAFARSIHQMSPRAEKPFVAVSCPSIPRDLIESELFGHTKGLLPGQCETRLALLRWLLEGPFFSTKLANFLWSFNRNCLRFCKIISFNPSAQLSGRM